MRTNKQLADLRQQAVALRLAGKSRREIKQILGPMSNSTLSDALQGTEPPAWTRRPNAKDDLREHARKLRAQFRSPTLKHHNPRTHRTNTGDDYHGCLRIDVRRSSHLYRKIEGWVSVITASKALSAA